MKLSIDVLRDEYVEKGYSYKRACGASFRDWKQKICDFLIDGGSIVVIYGSPGSGKSYFVDRLQPADDKSGIVDITGLSIQQNVFLKKLPTDRVKFLVMGTPLDVCVGRIRARPARPLSHAHGSINDGVEYCVGLAKRWFALYNGDWKHALPADSKITFVPKEKK